MAYRPTSNQVSVSFFKGRQNPEGPLSLPLTAGLQPVHRGRHQVEGGGRQRGRLRREGREPQPGTCYQPRFWLLKRRPSGFFYGPCRGGGTPDGQKRSGRFQIRRELNPPGSKWLVFFLQLKDHQTMSSFFMGLSVCVGPVFFSLDRTDPRGPSPQVWPPPPGRG